MDASIALGTGAVLLVAASFYLTRQMVGRRVHRRQFEGFVVYNSEQNELVAVPRYEFSEDVMQYLKSAFTENPALKASWEREPLSKFRSREGNGSARLVIEAAEYFFLSRLATHLEDYFNQARFSKPQIRTYGRGDVPDILFSNRLLELFSRPMEEREAFMDESFEEGPREIVAAYGADGYYEKFELVLPGP